MIAMQIQHTASSLFILITDDGNKDSLRNYRYQFVFRLLVGGEKCVALEQGSATCGSRATCGSLDVKLRLFSSIRKYYLFYKKKLFKNRSESINED
jgi:hypothetical protein